MERSRTLRTSRRTAELGAAPGAVWDAVASADEGSHWYTDAAPLRFRGALDRLVGGHRPHPTPARDLLREGDRVGFWRVVQADHRARRLVLDAVVRAPGRVRLTVAVAPLDGGRRSRVHLAIGFRPAGVLGAAYLVTDLGAREAVTELTMLHLLTELRHRTASRTGAATTRA